MAADLLLPLLFCGILCWGAVQGVDVFAAFRTGAARGLTAAGEILPSLIALVTAVAMLRAPGGTAAHGAAASGFGQRSAGAL